MATANEVIKGAFNNLAIYSPTDSVGADDADAALTKLNDYLNGLNARGCVFESVALTLTDPVPTSDQNLGDLKWALAKYMAPMWGKVLEGDALRMASTAERRFIAANTVLLPAKADGGLLNMPGQRTWW